MSNDPRNLNSIALAYIGDALLEILVRDHVILNLKIVKPNLLQKVSIEYVSGRAQASFCDHALKEKLFTSEELGYYTRGKNARDTRVLKNASPMAHRKSTGFECVLGYLHLTKQEDRIEELFLIYRQFIEENDTILKQIREKNGTN